MVRTLPPRPSSARHARSGNELAKENLAEPRLVIPAGLLHEISNEALQATHATGVAIAFEKGLEFTCQGVAGVATPEIGSKLNAASGLTGLCVSTSSLQWCNNTELDSRVDADACRLLGVRAIVIVPLLYGDRLVGLIEVFSRRPYAFGKRDLQILHDLAERTTSSVQVQDDKLAITASAAVVERGSLQDRKDGKSSYVGRLLAFFSS
jgi:GAF domain-containing protein